MRIRIVDEGRVLEGSAEQIVQQMQSIAFGRRDQSLVEYIEWIADNVSRFRGIALRVEGQDTAARARSLLEQMLEHKLAEKM